MKEKKPLAVGDRVRLSGYSSEGVEVENLVGRVEYFVGTGLVSVRYFIKSIAYTQPVSVFPSQCRRLITKPRREWWLGLRIHAVPGANIGFIEAKAVKPEEGFETADGKPWVHVREVKVRK